MFEFRTHDNLSSFYFYHGWQHFVQNGANAYSLINEISMVILLDSLHPTLINFIVVLFNQIKISGKHVKGYTFLKN